MNKFEILKEEELQKVVGGTYYGNGVSVIHGKVVVNWSTVWGGIVQRGFNVVANYPAYLVPQTKFPKY